MTDADAFQDAVLVEVAGVRIPFASPATLWRRRQTVRAKDIPDRLFLGQRLASQGIHVELPSPSPPPSNAPLSRGFRRPAAWWRK